MARVLVIDSCLDRALSDRQASQKLPLIPRPVCPGYPDRQTGRPLSGALLHRVGVM